MYTSAASPKLTAAPMKRPKEVAKAKAVARTDVPYCSGSHKLNMVKLPPKNPKKNSNVINVRGRRQIERPAEAEDNGAPIPAK